MLPCHIVRDLLPSYLEHLTGPETEADICEHLESCPDCRAARDAMAADLKAEKAPPPKLNFLKRLRWQQRLGAVLSVAATLLCLVGLYRLEYCYDLTDTAEMKEIIRDATVYGTNYVTIVEIMGRNAGWLTAAAALAEDEDCEGAAMICLPEIPFDPDHFIARVDAIQQQTPSLVVAVSEGVRIADGRYVCELSDDAHFVDAFGHKSLTGTARYLANQVAGKLKTKTRSIELSTLQRCAAHCASGTDIEEAFMSGKTAVEQMVAGQTDKMVGFECDRTNGYTCKAKLFDLSDVANFEKKFPAEWITPEGNNVTEDFIKYAMPLIQGETKLEKENGLPRFARLKKVFAK